MSTTSNAAWQQRRLAGTAVATGVFLTPVVAASATLWLLAHEVTGVPTLWRVLLLLVAASLAAYVAERAVRRFLPLAALLRLTMVFPDRAPSRFSVARQAGNPRALLERLESADLDEATAARTILGLVGALAAHDRKTRGHSERVRAYTDLLSEELGLCAQDRDRLRWSALLHDIGKLRVDTRILNKAGTPTEKEWDALRTHPEHGHQLVGPLLPWLGVWGRGIVEHHERYDGTGYPRGLSGSEISLAARLIAVVDSFETMTSVRAYKRALSHRNAREELARCAGAQFDPELVRAFLSISLPRVIWAMGPVSAVLQLPWATSLQFAGSRAIGVTGATAGAVTTPVLVASVAGVVAAPLAMATTTHHLVHAVSTVADHHRHDTTTAQTGAPRPGSTAGTSTPGAVADVRAAEAAAASVAASTAPGQGGRSTAGGPLPTAAAAPPSPAASTPHGRASTPSKPARSARASTSTKPPKSAKPGKTAAPSGPAEPSKPAKPGQPATSISLPPLPVKVPTPPKLPAAPAPVKASTRP